MQINKARFKELVRPLTADEINAHNKAGEIDWKVEAIKLRKYYQELADSHFISTSDKSIVS